MTTGTDTYPPLLKSTSGFTVRMIRRDWKYPFTTRKGSVKFFQEKYRLSFPQAMAW